MPAPILVPIVASAAGTLIGSIVSSVASPAVRPVTYLANDAMPSLLPGPDEYVKLYHSGNITYGAMAGGLHKHGIGVVESVAVAPAPQHWQRIVKLSRSKPNDGTVVNLWLADVISRNEADGRLKELGYSVKRERDLLLAEKTRFDLGTILRLYHTGWIDKDNAKTALRNIGYTKEQDRDTILSPENPLNTQDVITLMLRGLITPLQADELLERSGYRIDEERQKLLRLSQYIPPVTDLVRFVIKDVFDERIVREMGWDDEYEDQRERYEFWCKSQGLGTMTLPGNPDVNPINWPMLYYRANWQNISPTQAYSALHRLRPTTVTTGLPRDPNGIVFTRDDMERILRISDYPKKQRDWLIQTSYNPLTRVDVRRMYDVGVFGSKAADRVVDENDSLSVALGSPAGRELFEAYQDLGSNERDAARQAHFTIAEERTRRSKQIIGNARAAISDAYKTGVISFDEAAVRLYRVRLDDPGRRAAFDDLPRVEQVATARADLSTREALVQLDMQADTQIVKQWIRSIRTGYLTGRWTKEEAVGQLVRLGITDARRDRYTDLWDAMRSGSRKMLSVSQLMRYARYGIISPEDLSARLRNLGYSAADSRNLSLDVERNAVLDTNRALERAARNEQQRRNALQRQLRELRREQTATERRLLRLGTPSQLSEWVVRGLLNPDLMLSRLIQLGISRDDAETKVAEALQRRQERQERVNRG